MPPNIIEQGADEFLSSELEFLPPKDPLLFLSAGVWVRRKVVLIGAAGLVCLTALGLTVTSSISSGQRTGLQQIAGGLENDAISVRALAGSLKDLTGPVEKSGHPRAGEWMIAQAEFQKEADFWQKDAADLLSGIQRSHPSSLLDLELATRSSKIEHFREAQARIRAESGELRSRADGLRIAAGFYAQYPSLLAAIASPAAGAGLPAFFSSAFSQSGTDARQALDAGNRPTYAEAMARRASIQQQGERLNALSSELSTITASLAQHVSDPEAQKEARELTTAAETALSAGQLESAQNAIAQLRDYLIFVRSAFVLRIVNRPGIKSGIDRYFTDASGKRVAGYYVIVEALDSTGRAITQWIRNEEDGRLKQTTLWGERIPKDVYEKINKDKLDNGRIDQDIVGAKKAGSAKNIYSMIPQSVGRITRW